jgi:hypothetical protein
MKLTSYFSISKKMLLAGAVLLCASEFSAGRSMLNQEVDVFRAEILGSNDSLRGALTFDNFYRFDYANAGIGTVTFRASSKQFQSFVLDQDSPRAVGGRFSETSSFISPDFASGGSSFFVNPRFDDATSPDIVAAVPEPSTWLAGALALAALGFVRRRSLRRLNIHRA